MASITAPNHAKILTVSDGTKYGYIRIEAQPGKPTLLFVHGYPSSSYHWHNQVQQCIDAGYGMVAPDLLGYGDTDKPTEFSKYDCTVISRHLIEILDHENLPIVVGIGHDWGSSQLSTMEALLDIDAINAQVSKMIGYPIFGYWKFQNRPDAASIIEGADPTSTAALFYPADPKIWIDHMCAEGGMEAWIKEKKTGKIADWITPSEVETHRAILKAGGYTGPLNWYKQAMSGITHASEAKINPKYAETRFKVPTLFVGCENDMICRPAIQEYGMKDFFDDLTIKKLDTGHWIILEQPKELWEILHSWIEEKERKV